MYGNGFDIFQFAGKVWPKAPFWYNRFFMEPLCLSPSGFLARKPTIRH
jgi:hypothetical protein